MSRYGKAPDDLGLVDVSLPEVMYYLYLPIKLRDQTNAIIPENLRPLHPLIEAVCNDVIASNKWLGSNIYITVKKMYVSPQQTANRPGWHADGFGTNDLNYVWYDCLPTEFAVGDNFNITEGDHVKSLQEFDEQSRQSVVTTYPCKHLLRLDPFVVHRVAMADAQMMRTFVKISVSEDLYNLKDNSINPAFPELFGVKKYDREQVRNDPHQAQRDSYKPVTDDHFI